MHYKKAVKLCGNSESEKANRIRRVSGYFKAIDPREGIDCLLHPERCEDVIRAAVDCLNPNASPGYDGVSYDDFKYSLDAEIPKLIYNLRNLKAYKPQPLLSATIPKANGSLRKIAKPCMKDKVPQLLLNWRLTDFYESRFHSSMFGHSNKNQHAALRYLLEILKHGDYYLTNTDLKNFFPSIRHSSLKDLLDKDGVHPSLKYLSSKFLPVEIREPHSDSVTYLYKKGVAQGLIPASTYGNIYRHGRIDSWYENDFKPGCLEESFMIGYADDMTFVFKNEADSNRFEDLFAARLKECGLKLNHDKSQNLDAGQIREIHILGFTLSKTNFQWRFKTSSKNLIKTKNKIDIIFKQKGEDFKTLHKALRSFLRSHYGYFAIVGNEEAVSEVYRYAKETWSNFIKQKGLYRETYRMFMPLPRYKVLGSEESYENYFISYL